MSGTRPKKRFLVYSCRVDEPDEKIWLPKAMIAVVKKEWGHWEIIIPDWLVLHHKLGSAPFEEPVEVDIPF